MLCRSTAERGTKLQRHTQTLTECLTGAAQQETGGKYFDEVHPVVRTV